MCTRQTDMDMYLLLQPLIGWKRLLRTAVGGAMLTDDGGEKT